jgi:hypothetical protein
MMAEGHGNLSTYGIEHSDGVRLGRKLGSLPVVCPEEGDRFVACIELAASFLKRKTSDYASDHVLVDADEWPRTRCRSPVSSRATRCRPSSIVCPRPAAGRRDRRPVTFNAHIIETGTESYRLVTSKTTTTRRNRPA